MRPAIVGIRPIDYPVQTHFVHSSGERAGHSMLAGRWNLSMLSPSQGIKGVMLWHSAWGRFGRLIVSMVVISIFCAVLFLSSLSHNLRVWQEAPEPRPPFVPPLNLNSLTDKRHISQQWSPVAGSDKPYGPEYQGHSTPEDINRVANASLGFAKVFAIGLPERTDKRDAITLASKLIGFDIEYLPGVWGDQVVDAALPYGPGRKNVNNGSIGCWRGHMNAIRRIVDEDIPSALILEDDADWDIRLKLQLEHIAAGTRHLQKTSEDTTPSSPYGDDWDLLFLGHCFDIFPEMNTELQDQLESADPDLERKFLITGDPTLPPASAMPEGWVPFDHYPPRSRFVHWSGRPVCTYSYAVSQRGARKMLLALGLHQFTGPIDLSIADLCHRAAAVRWTGQTFPDDIVEGHGAPGHSLDMRCISVSPPVIVHHRARGSIDGDSDVNSKKWASKADDKAGKGDQPNMREKGFTEYVVWSTQNNLRRIIMGMDEMESQYEAGDQNGYPGYTGGQTVN